MFNESAFGRTSFCIWCEPSKFFLSVLTFNANNICTCAISSTFPEQFYNGFNRGQIISLPSPLLIPAGAFPPVESGNTLSCPGIALLCQVRFCFPMKGIPWSDLGVRFVTFPLFNCLCTPRRCEDRQLLSRHNIDTARWLSRRRPLLLICPDRPRSTWMIAGVTSQIR